jgi:septum formation protein
MQRLILASGSPRRKELLARIGIPFDVVVSEIDEELGSHSHAGTYAMAMSRDKARDVAEKLTVLQSSSRYAHEGPAVGLAGILPDPVRGCLVLAADTVVARKGHILGKPATREDALRMLRLLSGGWHEVVTGITLINTGTGEEATAVETTRVKFRKADEKLLGRYADAAEPYDKAGAYGIQGYGALLVERIEGDYHNVMGLPLQRLSQMLESMGIEPLSWLGQHGEKDKEQ